METPQFLVMMYFLIWFAAEFITFGLVGTNYLDVVGRKYRSLRDYVEAWLVRVTCQAALATVIFLGGFWG